MAPIDCPVESHVHGRDHHLWIRDEPPSLQADWLSSRSGYAALGLRDHVAFTPEAFGHPLLSNAPQFRAGDLERARWFIVWTRVYAR